MLFKAALAATVLLTSQVYAGDFGDVTLRTRRGMDEDMNLRFYADSLLDGIKKRQADTSGTMNASVWDVQTEAACVTQLMTLNGVASNPSGMAVCYNIPFFDNSTGVFQADLRLFMIGAATGDFAGIPSQDIMVGLQYNGATVSAVNESTLRPTIARREETYSLMSWPSSKVSLSKRAAPVLAQQYAFVGQINKELKDGSLNS